MPYQHWTYTDVNVYVNKIIVGITIRNEVVGISALVLRRKVF